jgi:hypothetical protein
MGASKISIKKISSGLEPGDKKITTETVVRGEGDSDDDNLLAQDEDDMFDCEDLPFIKKEENSFIFRMSTSARMRARSRSPSASLIFQALPLVFHR